jgi:predicted dehydrogenase
MTGIRVTDVCADFAIFHKTRKKPLKAIETYSGKLLRPEDYEEVPIDTEDYATVLLHFDSGAHGSFTVNQVAAGRKNRIWFEIYGSKKAVAINTERANEIWVGNRDAENGLLLKDASLMHPAAQRVISFPGGHSEGFPDTVKQFARTFYSYILEGGAESGRAPDFPTFHDGLREILLCENIVDSARSGRWVTI